MAFLSRKKLLEKEKLEKIKVEFSDGNYVYVKQMTGHERDNFEKSLMREVRKGDKIEHQSSLEDFRAKLAVCTLCDENDEALMQPQDYRVLSNNISATRLSKIADAAQKLNAISEEEKEDMVKNSEGDPAANSSSASAGN